MGIKKTRGELTKLKEKNEGEFQIKKTESVLIAMFILRRNIFLRPFAVEVFNKKKRVSGYQFLKNSNTGCFETERKKFRVNGNCRR